MEHIGEYKVDRTGWQPGPWDGEPDRVEFEAEGFPCLLVRSQSTGTWCGYVGVPPGHPCHGKGYDDVSVQVHGGLTYADKCAGHICHVPKPGATDDVWWLGFDLGHAWDLCPAFTRIPGWFDRTAGEPRDVYRHQAYAQNETIVLAKQLAAIERGEELAALEIGELDAAEDAIDAALEGRE
jgi:hypothetical protein